MAKDEVSLPRTTIMWLLFFHMSDIGTDIALNYDFYQNNDIFYFTASTCFLVLPNVMFAVIHFIMDPWQSKFEAARNIIFDVLGLQIFWRCYSAQNHEQDYSGLHKIHKQLVNLIRLFEAFFESIPQLVLQTYIFLAAMREGAGFLLPTYRNMLNIISVVFGFASLSSATTLADRQIDLTWEYYVNILFYFSQVGLRSLALGYFMLKYYMFPFYSLVIGEFIAMGIFFYLTERYCSSWGTVQQRASHLSSLGSASHQKWVEGFRFFFQTIVSSFIAYHVFYKKAESQKGLILIILIEILFSALVLYLGFLKEFKAWIFLVSALFVIIFVITSIIVTWITYSSALEDEEFTKTHNYPSKKDRSGLVSEYDKSVNTAGSVLTQYYSSNDPLDINKQPSVEMNNVAVPPRISLPNNVDSGNSSGYNTPVGTPAYPPPHVSLSQQPLLQSRTSYTNQQQPQYVQQQPQYSPLVVSNQEPERPQVYQPPDPSANDQIAAANILARLSQS